jgi:hypothetical protein
MRKYNLRPRAIGKQPNKEGGVKSVADEDNESTHRMDTSLGELCCRPIVPMSLRHRITEFSLVDDHVTNLLFEKVCSYSTALVYD